MSDTLILEVFTFAVLALLALDFVLQGRDPQPMRPGKAGLMTAFWISLSLLFGAFVWQTHGSTKGLEFYTGYLIEYSLSVDNLFIFVALFGYFRVRNEFQHRVLFWGIIGAMILRGAMILIGVALVTRFSWILYGFGAFLILTGFNMILHRGVPGSDMGKNKVLKFLRATLPISSEAHSPHLLIKTSGKWMLTSLGLVLLMVEATDLIFAMDSIPAVFAVTQDRLIIFTSNICAILGLRSLYFILAGGMKKFIYLKVGLSVILIFVGAKMLFKLWFHPSILVSLGVIVGVLGASMMASLFKRDLQ